MGQGIYCLGISPSVAMLFKLFLCSPRPERQKKRIKLEKERGKRELKKKKIERKENGNEKANK